MGIFEEVGEGGGVEVAEGEADEADAGASLVEFFEKCPGSFEYYLVVVCGGDF